MGNQTAYSQGNEYSIKAMFLFNFIKYVEWPATTEQAAFRIGVIGDNPIVEALQVVAAQKKTDARRIEIVRITSISDADCQILFFPHGENGKLEEWAKKVAGKGVLLITDDAKNSHKGAAINLLHIDNKIRFEINQSCGRNSGVKISSQLSTLAVSVNP